MLVVGGGAAGLAAAHRLRQAGRPVRVLEASDAIGGKLSTTERDGYVIDQGAFFLPTTHDRLLAIAGELGIGSRLADGGFVLAVVRDGRVHRVRGAHLARDVATTSLISPRAKLGLAKLVPEVIRARRATFARIAETASYDSATVAEWAARLHPDVAEFVIGATMRAVFAIEPERAAKVDFHGVIALFGGAKLVAFDRGMAVYAEAVSRELDVALGARVVSVEEDGDGVTVDWVGHDGEHTERAEGCVLAIPAAAAADVHRALDPSRAAYLRRVRDGNLLVLSVALHRPPAGIDATYLQIPESVHPFLGGISFDHHKAIGRVPDGRGLLTLAPLNGWCEAHWDDDEEAIVAALLGALERVLPGTADQVEFTMLKRWNQQYNPVGHYRGIGAFRAACAQRDRLVQLAGEYHSTPNLNAATASGEAAARRLLAGLGARPVPAPA